MAVIDPPFDPADEFDPQDESQGDSTRSIFNWRDWQATDGPDGPLGRDDLEDLTDEDPHPPRIGKYRLCARVPGGSTTTVKYLAVDSLGRRYLLKVLWQDDPDIKHLLQQEVRLARRIRSDRVARVLGYHEGRAADGRGCAYVVQRFVSGRTLRQVLDATPGGRLTGPDLLHTALGTFRAICDAHRGAVVHGDISPTNWIVTPERPVMVDLGGGRADEDKTRQHMFGTVGYLSLEHLQATRDVLAASDLQSWAHMIAEAGTGHRPYDPAGTLTAGEYGQVILDGHVPPDLTGLPDGLAEIVRALLVERDPAKRPKEAWIEHRLAELVDAASPTGTRQLSLLYPALDDGTARVVPTLTSCCPSTSGSSSSRSGGTSPSSGWAPDGRRSPSACSPPGWPACSPESCCT